MRFFFGVVVLAMAASAVAPAQTGTAAAGASSGFSPAQRQLAIDSFEQIWTTVRDKHWDPTLGGLNWQAVHDELRPKLDKAADMDEARAIMGEMLHRLKQTHFGIVPTEAYRELDTKGGDKDDPTSSFEGGPGIDARVIDGHALVTSVEANSPAETQGVKPGWEILRVDGKEIGPALSKIRDSMKDQLTLLDLMQSRIVTGRLAGQVGQAVEIEFLDGRDKKTTLKLVRIKPRGKLAVVGNLPPVHFWVDTRKLGGDIGYVTFNLFVEPDTVAAAFQDMVKSCTTCKGFVIDVRGNPGGIGGQATGIAGWFTDKPKQQLGKMFLRGASMNFAVFPRPNPYLGPLAILVDGNSASTSEIFAGGLQDLKRARIIGTRTAGAALPSIFTKLPDGDGFQYAIANYISEGGKPLEGIGVTPDEEVKLTRHQLLEGQDPVLDAAVSWIRKQNQ